MRKLLLVLPLCLGFAAPAFAVAPGPVTPQACGANSVVTSGTAVTALSGPTNGFALSAGATAIFWSLIGNAGTAVGSGTLTVPANSQMIFDEPLAAGVALTVDAGTSGTPFGCVRW